MQENTSASETNSVMSANLSKLFLRNFDLAAIAEEPAQSEIPLSDDTNFEYINLDIDRLNKSKKTNFWTYLIEIIQPHTRLGEVLTIDKLISHYPSYEEPLFPMKSKYTFIVEKVYNWVLRLIGDAEPPIKRPEDKIRKMFNLIIDAEPVVRDEFFVTLIKCSRNNPRKESVEKVWQLLALACGVVLPSKEFLPALYNYLILVVDNFPEERFKEWARYSLKRLFYLDKNKFKRNFSPSNQEIFATRARKKIVLTIYLQNGNSFRLNVESYFTTQDILKHALNSLSVARRFWPYFYLIDSIVKSKSLDERPLNENLMIGDVLSGWEIIAKSSSEPVKTARLFLGLKFFPEEAETIDQLLPFIYFAKLYDVYYHKCNIDRADLIKLFGYAMQHDFGNYEDKPGVRNKVRNYFHPSLGKYYADDSFVNSVLAAYKASSNQLREACEKRLCGLDNFEFEFPAHFFTAKFRNANNPIYKDMQDNLVIKVTKTTVAICEEISKEKIVEIKLEEVMNWGVNDDILVLCYGDKFDVIKLYFQVYNPIDLAEILYNYGNQIKSGEHFDYISKNEHLEKFVKNSKVRKSNVFPFK